MFRATCLQHSKRCREADIGTLQECCRNVAATFPAMFNIADVTFLQRSWNITRWLGSSVQFSDLALENFYLVQFRDNLRKKEQKKKFPNFCVSFRRSTGSKKFFFEIPGSSSSRKFCAL
ncbi:hypothetical protein PV325_004182 [Microctonus aethiopoides]|nr:hypothetical protein PV325_004182 [Microctonus aethiopoides]KAK0093763.1 hypothetical protein PV326_012719 [Microctonus aethiopoides]